MARLRFTLPTLACVSLSASLALCAAPAVPAAAAANGEACANANATPTPGNLEQVRAAVECLVNQERERHGEAALRENAQLRQSAQGHSDSMAAEDYFEHVGPGGDTPLDRMRAAGYVSAEEGCEVGENIAWGTLSLSTPRAVVAAWMASPGHRANILDAHFRDTGVGVSTHVPSSMGHGQSGGLYTQDFGVLITSNAARYEPAPAARHNSASGPQHSPTHASPHHAADNTTHQPRHNAKPAPGYNLPASTTKRRHKGYGSTRRKVRHRHRLSARHRARHRRAVGRAGRKRTHQRSRR